MVVKKTEIAHEVVLCNTKLIVTIWNSNIISKVDHVISKIKAECDVKWLGKNEHHVDNTEQKLFY